MKFHAFTLVLFLSVGSLCSEASAQQGDPQAAKELFVEAKRLNEEGRVKEAIQKLEAAYEAYPSDAILLTIANRYLDLDEPEEAQDVLARLGELDRKLKRQKQKLQRSISRLLDRPVQISWTSETPGVTVSVDGQSPEELPVQLKLSRGMHELVFSAPDRADLVQQFEVRGPRLQARVAELKPEEGYWRVMVEQPDTLADIKVSFDGEPIRFRPSERASSISEARPAAPGVHRLTCLKGYEARSDAELEVFAGEETRALCQFSAESLAAAEKAARTAAPIDHQLGGWITLGLAIAAIGAGTGVMVDYYARELPMLEDEWLTLTTADCPVAPCYRIQSNKPAWGGATIGLGVALGVVSALFFGEVFE